MYARRWLSFFALLVLVAVPASAAGAQPNGRIVFTSDREASWNSELYSAAPDGTDVKRLSWTDGWEQDPAWSPDGTKIAYESSFEGRFRLFVSDASGNGQTPVSPDAVSAVDDVQPDWSPDGGELAFASTRPFNQTWDIWVMHADGTGLRRLTNGRLAQDPAWSPDGAEIAFDSYGAIFVVAADGSSTRRLTTPPSGNYDEGPAWSPDGSTIAFSRRDFSGTSSALYAVGADGADARQLTSGAFADYRPSWSPDGTTIAFDRRESGDGTFQLYTVGVAGGGVTKLLSSSGNDMGPSWGTSSISPTPLPPLAPEVHIVSPRADGPYAQGADVPFYFYCTSWVSFVVSCEGSAPLGSLLDTAHAGSHTVSVTATDFEGRQASATVTYTVFDLTPPRIDFRTPSDGARYGLGDQVTVDYTCTDDVSVAHCGGDLPPGAPLDTSSVGTHSFHVVAYDLTGNRGEATATYTVVDRTPPAITITTPANDAVFTLGQAVEARYSCVDQPGGAGVESCSGPTALGTSSVGAKSFTVTASDRAGNTASASRAYTVVYDFAGFFAPAAAYPAAATVRAGESVPLKFSLRGDQGTRIFAAGSPSWASCGGSGELGPVGGSLSYNASLDRYTYLAPTAKSWAGTCRELVVTLADGTAHRARLTFK